MAIARNTVLFCLGIMLLELGYSKPWVQLQEWVFQNLPPDKQTDYHTAEKLAQAPGLRSRMGPRSYNEYRVQYCLDVRAGPH